MTAKEFGNFFLISATNTLESSNDLSIFLTSTVLTVIFLPKIMFLAIFTTPLMSGAAVLATVAAVPMAAMVPVTAIW
jgi:hypothetical protein